jgi:hypothetical protein
VGNSPIVPIHQQLAGGAVWQGVFGYAGLGQVVEKLGSKQNRLNTRAILLVIKILEA